MTKAANPGHFSRSLLSGLVDCSQVAIADDNDEYLVLVMHDATNHFGFQHWFKQACGQSQSLFIFFASSLVRSID